MLKTVLAENSITHDQLANDVGLSRPALSALVNHDRWPVSTNARELRAAISKFLQARGIDAKRVFCKEASPRANAATPSSQPQTQVQENQMLLRKQTLSQAARRVFNLQRNPFAEPTQHTDVFMSPDIRYVREAMHGVTRHGGFLAVVGESGAGKSTLREELLDRVQREKQSVLVAQPYVLGMEDSDSKGKTLRAQHIAESIMSAVAPLARIASSPEQRFAQLHKVLIGSSRAGNMHVLIIEEAHALPVPTLIHLKRFIELKDGMRPLLGVILMGQSELVLKLSQADQRVREVVQRLEIVQLPPLDAQLESYLAHKFERAGTALTRVLEPGAIEALRVRLTPTDSRRRQEGSLLYPLAVQNVLTAAINAAAELGCERVTADIVKEV
ncbi:MAG TPA: AAA family ATPase [Tahibacter sp.]|uniref:ExeA family protein n=1 Tax=Tahibacter sp. TaxID=2056211 RepID=UPI002BC61E8A|nr:AAA family ATPase [Tahibacter sp.]HSX60240.1 AAA family ATPase [Tahibacter sp.]